MVRLKVPAGYKVPSDKLDEAKGTIVKAGGFSKAGKGMPHYAWFTEDTVIQVHGMWPSGINSVNPADDPEKQLGPGRTLATGRGALERETRDKRGRAAPFLNCGRSGGSGGNCLRRPLPTGPC